MLLIDPFQQIYSCHFGHGVVRKNHIIMIAAARGNEFRCLTAIARNGDFVFIFIEKLRGLQVTPHVAQNTTNRQSAIDARTTRHEGYAVSQRKRKRVEEVFGWLKTVALQRKTRFRGPDRVGWMFTLAAAAYNLVRMRNLMAQAA